MWVSAVSPHHFSLTNSSEFNNPNHSEHQKARNSMWVSAVSLHHFSLTNSSQFDNPNNLITRWRPEFTSVRCSTSTAGRRSARTRKSYHELLGDSVDSNTQQIKEAYRKLQKKYHPDVAGEKGHEYSLMLNEAYGVLAWEDLRREYDASIGQMRVGFWGSFSGLGYGSWKGPLRPQASIGSRECVHHAGNTFVMVDALGCARVKVRYGDDDKKIEVWVDSCLVNWIHWVDREELAILKFLIQPQPQEGCGVFGGGWERPAIVFMAAKPSKKRPNQQDDYNRMNASREEKTSNSFVEKVKEIVSSRVAFLVGLVSEKGK
ncbi:Chaperone protein dnaJ C76, chloroplastic [Vitis vinifera]|uniref:Chaperone protein dnaJ C76, chloroplastic n=1 Tax=Vitis vinifera TaxID=29760 RepID=A0A438DY00_VITVI|nr:Chaperone protein dnaJ C76, chloroplastic [Vitis vinifera]